MRGFGAALSLLTRLPAGRADWGEQDMQRSVRWFPLVGALIGLAVAAVYAGLSVLLPAAVAAGVAVACGVLVTGALHEDGLADTMDGFGGGSGREDTLRIMKDPSHGTYGVLALALSVLLRTVTLAALLPVAAWAILPMVHAMSRGGAIATMGALPPATGDGLGAAHVTDGLRRQVVFGVATALLIGLALVGWWVAVLLIGASVVTALMARTARKRISGFTGDVLGAVEQACEVTLLLLGVALVKLDSAPWGIWPWP